MALALRGLDPRYRPAAEAALSAGTAAGLAITVTSVRRTWGEQADLRQDFERCVASGLFGRQLKPGCVAPAAKPGDSAHGYGFAWDSVVPPEQLPLWTAIRRGHGWHVSDTDPMHAEVSGWPQLVDTWSQPQG